MLATKHVQKIPTNVAHKCINPPLDIQTKMSPLRHNITASHLLCTCFTRGFVQRSAKVNYLFSEFNHHKLMHLYYVCYTRRTHNNLPFNHQKARLISGRVSMFRRIFFFFVWNFQRTTPRKQNKNKNYNHNYKSEIMIFDGRVVVLMYMRGGDTTVDVSDSIQSECVHSWVLAYHQSTNQ